MSDMRSDADSVKIPGRWDIPYQYSAGATATRFFRELKEHRRIMATRCPSCARTLLPPRSFCERCFVSTNDWVEVGPEGRVESFTVTYQPFPGLREPPFAIALIRLDGASTSFAHFLGEIDPTRPAELMRMLKQGFRVGAVFKLERTGSILDIEYFRPLAAGPRT